MGESLGAPTEREADVDGDCDGDEEMDDDCDEENERDGVPERERDGVREGDSDGYTELPGVLRAAASPTVTRSPKMAARQIARWSQSL